MKNYTGKKKILKEFVSNFSDVNSFGCYRKPVRTMWTFYNHHQLSTTCVSSRKTLTIITFLRRKYITSRHNIYTMKNETAPRWWDWQSHCFAVLSKWIPTCMYHKNTCIYIGGRVKNTDVFEGILNGNLLLMTITTTTSGGRVTMGEGWSDSSFVDWGESVNGCVEQRSVWETSDDEFSCVFTASISLFLSVFVIFPLL